MSVLVLHHHLAVFGDGDDIDPIGKLEYIPCGDLGAGRHLDAFLTDRQPRSKTENILGFEDFPGPIL